MGEFGGILGCWGGELGQFRAASFWRAEVGSGPSISGPCRPRCRPTANTSPHILDSTRVVEDRHTLRALGLRPPRDKLEGELTNPTHHPRNTHRTFKKPTIIAFCGPGPSNIQPCLNYLLFYFRRPSEMLPLVHLVAPEHQQTQPRSI